jgi:preprotein translocase SecE subunit
LQVRFLPGVLVGGELEGRVGRMPPETKEQPEAAAEDRDERDEKPSKEVVRAKPDYAGPAAARASGPGFFAITKKGQGYWTRMGTAFGAGLLGFLTAYNIYVYLPVLVHFDTTVAGQARAKQVAMIVAAVFFAAFAFFAWRMMNKPSNVDFLVATDSEMKKVNWTSRKDLIGSTKVVIIFMFLIALFLFAIDILFSYFFYLIGVLKHSPFGGGGTIGGG